MAPLYGPNAPSWSAIAEEGVRRGRKFREVRVLIRSTIPFNALDRCAIAHSCVAARPPAHSLRAPCPLTVRLHHPSDVCGNLSGDLDNPALFQYEDEIAVAYGSRAVGYQ